MKEECGGGQQFIYFCSNLHSYCSKAFSVLHCALCCTYVHTHIRSVFISIGFGVNAKLQGKECLYLVTFIVPEFPQAFSSGFLNSFIQQTTIEPQFFSIIPSLSSN